MARRTRDLGDSLGTFEVAFTAAFAMLAPATRARHLAALWRLDVGLREKTLWRLLYETAARATEILTLDIADLDRPGKRARVVSKAGTLTGCTTKPGPRCCYPDSSPPAPGDRCSSPGGPPPERCPPWTCAPTPAGPDCPTGARPNCSHTPAHPLRPPPDSRQGGPCTSCATLHWPTTPEGGTNTPMLLARSRHASMRSLERYARPGPEALARLSRRSDRHRRPTTQPVETHPQRPSHRLASLPPPICPALQQRVDGPPRRDRRSG